MVNTLFSYERFRRDLLLILCFLVGGFLFIYFFVETSIEVYLPKQVKMKTLEEKTLVLDRLFPAKERQISLSPVDFSKELCILTSPQRPDSIDKNRLFLAHKTGWMREEVFLDNWIYLKEQPQGYFLSKEKTPLAFRVVENRGKLFVEQDLKFEIDSEKFQISSVKGFYPEVKPLEEKNLPDYFSLLFISPFIGKDILKKGDFYLMELDNIPIFIKQNDLFVFQDGKWQKSKGNDTKGLPIFRVGDISDSRIFIEGWDGEGRYFYKILFTQRAKEPLKKSINWISQVKKRTNTKVSMSLLGKRMILKKGDWLVEKNKKWIALRTDSQKENFLKQKLESEVFVFEDIEENKGDKKLIGFLYNPTRTKALKMEIPFGSKTTIPVPKIPTPEQKSMYTPLKGRGDQ